MSNYTDQIRNFLSNQDEKMVQVGEVSFPVKRPSAYSVMEIIEQNEKNNISDMVMGIRIVQLCLPEGLTEPEVFELMTRAKYFDDENKSELRQAVDEYCDFGGNQAAEAGESPEADADFGQPEAQTAA